MKLTVVCQTCGRVLSVVEKDEVSQEDINMYTINSLCPIDFVEEQVVLIDGEGNPILDEDENPLYRIVRTSSIIAVKTEN